jgi:hypothetical protein
MPIERLELLRDFSTRLGCTPDDLRRRFTPKQVDRMLDLYGQERAHNEAVAQRLEKADQRETRRILSAEIRRVRNRNADLFVAYYRRYRSPYARRCSPALSRPHARASRGRPIRHRSSRRTNTSARGDPGDGEPEPPGGRLPDFLTADLLAWRVA